MIDWSTMSPRAIWLALHSLPKVVGPWTAVPKTNLWRREAAVGGQVVAWVGKMDVMHDDPLLFFASKELADAKLRADGWLLVDEEGER